MRRSIPAAFAAAALFPAAAVAQDKSCADEFAAIEKQIHGSALQAEYEGREGAHPLVLVMANGELVDLSGTIITATPYESWLGDRPVVDKVGGFLTEAKPLIEAGDEEGCSGLLEQARAEIASLQTEEEETEEAAADEPDAGAAEEESDAAAAGSDAGTGAAVGEEPAGQTEGEPATDATEEEAGGTAAESEPGAAEPPAEGQQPEPVEPPEEELEEAGSAE